MHVIKGLFLVWFSFLAIVGFAQSTLTTPSSTDTFAFETDTNQVDSLALSAQNTPTYNRKTFALLDSISNDTLRRMLVKPYQFLVNDYFQKPVFRKNLPTVKEVKFRQKANQPWKFWVVVFIISYIAFVRIMNPNNFRVFMLSVFNLKLSDKIWEDQRSFFGFVILQLFAIYLFIASLFINDLLESRNILWVGNYFIQFVVVFAILTLVYSFKFLTHIVLGSILQLQKLGIGFISNTISVNNFLALVIFPLIVFTLYHQNQLWSSVLAQAVIAVFGISIFYRVVRITLLSNRFFSFPKIYLFIYLCALEILPWFIIIQFINNAQF
ncbi:MAG: DUF4271 domain-containing protein [Bacteroidia bacterium]|nr:DUF4271 domain-containing protein [Bacteroidia bacterium]